MMSPLEIDQLADALEVRMGNRWGEKPVGEVLKVKEVAELLQCSVPTVERMTRRGEIPSFKIGSGRRYLRADVLECLAMKDGKRNSA